METNEANYINDSITSVPQANYMRVCVPVQCKLCGHVGWDIDFDKVAFIEYKKNCSVAIHHFICPECGGIDNYKNTDESNLQSKPETTHQQKQSFRFIIENPDRDDFIHFNYKEWHDSIDILHSNAEENEKLWRSHYKNVIDFLKNIVNEEK